MTNDVVYDETMPDHQQAMIDACRTGDLARLRELFLKYGVKPGDAPVNESWVLDLTSSSIGPKRYIQEAAAQYGAPTTAKLFEAAAASKKPTMILLLLKTYPKYNFWDCGIMNMALTKDDLKTFEKIFVYDQGSLQFSYDMDMTMTFHDTTLARFVSVAVNDPKASADWLCREGNMTSALVTGMLGEAIDKILDINPGSIGLSCLMRFALRTGHVEVLELYCERGKLHLETLSDEEMERAVAIGQQINCHKLVALLEDSLRRRQEKDSSEGDLGEEKVSISEKEMPDRKWCNTGNKTLFTKRKERSVW